MRFTWDEVKRKRNLKDHGLDFADAKRHSRFHSPYRDKEPHPHHLFSKGYKT